MKNSMKTTDFDSIKSKYVVYVHILEIDKKGNRKNENSEHIFDEGELLEKRRSAIEKAQEIMCSFDDDENFSSPFEAQAKRFKDFKSYSIDIFLVVEEEGREFEYHLYGDDESSYYSLQQEAFFFRQMFEITKFVEIEDEEEDTIEVIEENLDFFLS